MRNIALSCVLLALATSCVSPVVSRINKNHELFASFPPEVQENIRTGRVAIGYTTDMVSIAMGRPDRIYRRETASGDTLIWSYAARDYDTTWHPVETLRVYRDKQGRRRYTSDLTWVDVSRYTEFEAIRIEFDNGKIKAIETAK